MNALDECAFETMQGGCFSSWNWVSTQQTWCDDGEFLESFGFLVEFLSCDGSFDAF